MWLIMNKKRTSYGLMAMLVFIWGFEYIAAKSALDTIKPITLVFFKYFLGAIVLLCIKLLRDRCFPFKVRDIPFFILCAIFGDILYYASEYQAMSYLPVSVITIILAFVPAVSILLEGLIYKRRPTLLICLGIVLSVIGVGMVVGADFGALFKGKAIGYMLAFFAVFSWNAYNFITARRTGRYKPLDLTIYQLVAAILVAAPFAVFDLPSFGAVNTSLVLAILYLGLFSSAFGFLVYVNSVRVIGVTPSALFSNMLPVTAALFGWLLLGERLSALQIVGGIVVIAAGSMVIFLKGEEIV
jgi:drug/metabolite transporter (DMT)-like permease